MLSFECDYNNGAHPQIMKRLLETNEVAQPGYGEDAYCASAKEKIKKAIGREDAEIWFVVGGTQTNQLVIDTLLTKYQGVMAATTGHVSCHEAGAIEAVGHKVITLPQTLGKINATDIVNYMEIFYGDESHDHMVFPGMVYISHPTEYGTLYTKEELTSISEVCHRYELPLYLDGARLGYGLAADTDVTIQDIAALTDVFYIGGTKVGALCGEAIVFTHGNMPKHFVTSVKQHGALLAKGRLLGVQFDTLFTDDLYMEISRHAIKMADRMKKIFTQKGYSFFLDSPTNQIFVILENQDYERIRQEARISFWEKYDDTHTVVRFASSWATREEDVDMLEKLL